MFPWQPRSGGATNQRPPSFAPSDTVRVADVDDGCVVNVFAPRDCTPSPLPPLRRQFGDNVTNVPRSPSFIAGEVCSQQSVKQGTRLSLSPPPHTSPCLSQVRLASSPDVHRHTTAQPASSTVTTAPPGAVNRATPPSPRALSPSCTVEHRGTEPYYHSRHGSHHCGGRAGPGDEGHDVGSQTPPLKRYRSDHPLLLGYQAGDDGGSAGGERRVHVCSPAEASQKSASSSPPLMSSLPRSVIPTADAEVHRDSQFLTPIAARLLELPYGKAANGRAPHAEQSGRLPLPPPLISSKGKANLTLRPATEAPRGESSANTFYEVFPPAPNGTAAGTSTAASRPYWAPVDDEEAVAATHNGVDSGGGEEQDALEDVSPITELSAPALPSPEMLCRFGELVVTGAVGSLCGSSSIDGDGGRSVGWTEEEEGEGVAPFVRYEALQTFLDTAADVFQPR